MPVTPITISAPDDPRVADFVALTDVEGRRRRESDEYFVAEGLISIQRLLESGYRIRGLLLTPSKYERLAPLLETVDAPVYVASKPTMAATVGFALHRGAVASADRRTLPTLEDALEGASRIAVLEGLNDPENLGVIARSARAFGIEVLVLDPTCIDPYYRRTVRVSMGEILFLRVTRAEPWPAALEVLHDLGFESWALTPGTAQDTTPPESIWDLPVPERLALVLGAEGPGLTPSTLRRATRRVRIPIAPSVDSLNVGAAAAVSFAIAARQR